MRPLPSVNQALPSTFPSSIPHFTNGHYSTSDIHSPATAIVRNGRWTHHAQSTSVIVLFPTHRVPGAHNAAIFALVSPGNFPPSCFPNTCDCLSDLHRWNQLRSTLLCIRFP